MSVLSFESACNVVDQYCRKLAPSGHDVVTISAALGRVLAEPLVADRDFPPFPRSTRDGYALRAADLQSVPASLTVMGQIKAGGTFEGSVCAGQAVQIMTGASVPPGTDAVVMVEYTKRNGQQVEVLRPVVAGENVVPQGSEAKAGQQIVPSGTRLAPSHIAVAASVGKHALRVSSKPRVAILATGDELVDIAAEPAAHQIRNSNTYSLSAQVTAAGGAAIPLAIAPDEEPSLKKQIHEGLKAHLLILSGGVSMGEVDLVEKVLNETGARFFFTGVQIQPGKPIVFGEVGSTPIFGLPGNPVSTMVTFDLFVRPVIQSLAGQRPVRLPAAKARLARDVRVKTGLTRFLPAALGGGLFDPEVEIVPWQGSGDIAASSRANCYAIIPPDRERIAAGELISVLLRP